ncbi:MAG: hypothetical protein JOS17DRAFT_732844 [Linnemannia elongata]|nr:MAG: hypothetical protein JOS17DRAFT_732844 [Linnemannia elongata]
MWWVWSIMMFTSEPTFCPSTSRSIPTVSSKPSNFLLTSDVPRTCRSGPLTLISQFLMVQYFHCCNMLNRYYFAS